jgi:hypothetical protein
LFTALRFIGLNPYLDWESTLYKLWHGAQWILGDSSNKKQVLVDQEALNMRLMMLMLMLMSMMVDGSVTFGRIPLWSRYVLLRFPRQCREEGSG